MELTHEFSVSVPVDAAWSVLTDLERIAPCMPGAELREVDGDEYRGVVKVKVGPMTAQYKGVASFLERDEQSHRAVVRAEGRETRGQGNASATVTATLEPVDGGTRVVVHTDLKITGRVAQFGRGVLADVSAKLLGQFARALEADVLAGAAPAATGPGAECDRPTEAVDEAPISAAESTAVQSPTAESSGARRIESESAEPVDLIATAGSSVLKRVVPIVVVLAVALWLLLR